MSLLNDILVWTTTSLAPWQRDAVRRLFQQQGLSQQDYDDLYAMLKSASGLPDPQNRQPVPIAQEHLPVQRTRTSAVTVKALRDLKHVNRIAPGQRLEFSATGITVIYGGNGSGKSGYSRVLKRACRARDLLETVHPDAFDPQAGGHIPEAVFDIEVGGEPRSLVWRRDAPPPEELATIAVFDSRCARAYLDAEQDAAYLPYGLDIVENLGQRVLPKLSERLNAEIESVNTDTSPFADLWGETAVGKMIASLTADTNPKNVVSLGTLTPDETTRLLELEKALAESDPKAKAQSLRLSAKRIEGLITRVDASVLWVDDAAVEKLKAKDNKAEDAIKAEALAAANFQSRESLLPGTGQQSWKMLFEAARRFSIDVAYPGMSFPNAGPGAKCPLCQQALDPEATERMRRFEEFVEQDTAKIVAEERQHRKMAAQSLVGASLGFGLDVAIKGELEQLDANLLEAVEEYEKRVETRKGWMLAALETHAWETVPPLNGDPCPRLKTVAQRLVAQASDLDRAADEKRRQALEVEREALRTRMALSRRLNPILDLIKRMQLKAALMKCKGDLKTKAISDKAKEFASRAVTEALRNALNNEFQLLGVGYIKTKLNERVEQGRMKHKLVLDLPITRKLDEILSEGEQRAIAIGSFLAELHLAGHQGGIVFDDPVSSLDHHWRRKVANRLATEAKQRQVIILTHDTVFLGELLHEVKEQNVEHRAYHLEWMGKYPGCVNEGLPWEHMPYKERLDKLEKTQRAMARTWSPYPNQQERDAIRRQYDLLRAAIERVVEDVVLNGVVKRYEDWIRVGELGEVVGFTTTEYEEIVRLHKVCCDVVTAHDPSSAKNAPVPTPTELGKHIADLQDVIGTIKARRKQVAGNRVSTAP